MSRLNNALRTRISWLVKSTSIATHIDILALQVQVLKVAGSLSGRDDYLLKVPCSAKDYQIHLQQIFTLRGGLKVPVYSFSIKMVTLHLLTFCDRQSTVLTLVLSMISPQQEPSWIIIPGKVTKTIMSPN